MAVNNESLRHLPTPETQAKITEAFWHQTDNECISQQDVYFQKHYFIECQKHYANSRVQRWSHGQAAATTHSDILSLAFFVSANSNLPKGALKRKAKQTLFPNAHEEAIEESMELVLRLWLMIHIRTNRKVVTPGMPAISWIDNIPKLIIRGTSRHAAISPILTDIRRSLIPASVLQEILLSLDLLFPPNQQSVLSFLADEQKDIILDGSYGRNRPLHLGHFNHLKDRILEIDDLFHTPAPGWSQLLADKRNLQQYYTFWIALVVFVLTVVFGFISSVTGIIQCYASMQALELARKQSQ
ncbi:uncharacterized protein KY384_002982 [Bacidia gigantensis]|uniref:uncharacterized protein n=1 Tax=Bacidia gigantensis TaxID=2732470 RepID=UPI001D0521B1|nr:uncharacterized protein KY384_002982 [Bacidia gigantensis]KAG8531353.1 hypothetical protein KY384_002982 [Bacidia gigantensis]